MATLPYHFGIALCTAKEVGSQQSADLWLESILFAFLSGRKGRAGAALPVFENAS
jgi:hypothetical protein